MKKLLLSVIFGFLMMLPNCAQTFAGGINSGGIVYNGFSSALGELSDELLESTLSYEYEEEWGYIASTYSTTIGDVKIRLAEDRRLIVFLPKAVITGESTLSLITDDGKLISVFPLKSEENYVTLPCKPDIIIAKVTTSANIIFTVKFRR